MADDAKKIRLDDPRVVDLGKFLQESKLSNGTVANIPGGVSELLAQAILHWQDNLVYDQGDWVSRSDIENTPGFGEIEIRTIGNEEAFRLCHRPTGIVALEETREAALRVLKSKVRAAAAKEATDGE